MSPLRFAIEGSTTIRGALVVFARQLDSGSFEMQPGLRFAGRTVRAFQIPRSIAADGSQRLDVFAFTVDDETGKFNVGDVVELTTGANL